MGGLSDGLVTIPKAIVTDVAVSTNLPKESHCSSQVDGLLSPVV